MGGQNINLMVDGGFVTAEFGWMGGDNLDGAVLNSRCNEFPRVNFVYISVALLLLVRSAVRWLAIYREQNIHLKHYQSRVTIALKDLISHPDEDD